MKTDFNLWKQETLAKLAKEQQEEIVRLNNQHCATLKTMQSLAESYAELCNQFCKVPVRNVAYRAATEALK